ncbi:hypothetical protein Lh8105_07210 [Lactobacillus helveticus]|uniref:Uncharacterized protein n=1 Tax=Lactobacillus helveticus TaxID=1587 RepID=A0AAU8XV02_LACHE|nr:hypothetical protein [Lactobacillus helveticus]AUI74571.1 hypothetical protein Lh8105_07210 [Lactobacillus helveticus]MCT3401681.1 hypothetical protein [Lactobacillus helveticus]MCT3404802.1 hypothetical protein [Lactobacillus helveticus]MCT3418935.1 hypothetical protein [Lactobacillus helveticus]MCT3421549.1 hypothetical protein [Lactobacillus helveticus]
MIIITYSKIVNYRKATQWNSHEIEKLEQIDQIMFNLTESKDFKADLTKEVQYLKQAKLTKNPATEQDLINTYIKDIRKRIPLNVIVHFNIDVLKHYVNSRDDLKENLAKSISKSML